MKPRLTINKERSTNRSSITIVEDESPMDHSLKVTTLLRDMSFDVPMKSYVRNMGSPDAKHENPHGLCSLDCEACMLADCKRAIADCRNEVENFCDSEWDIPVPDNLQQIIDCIDADKVGPPALPPQAVSRKKARVKKKKTRTIPTRRISNRPIRSCRLKKGKAAR